MSDPAASGRAGAHAPGASGAPGAASGTTSEPGVSSLAAVLATRRRPFRAGRAAPDRALVADGPADFAPRPLPGFDPAGSAVRFAATGADAGDTPDAGRAPLPEDGGVCATAPEAGASDAAAPPGADALAQARADGFAAGREAGRCEAEAQLGAGMEDIARLARNLARERAVDPDALVEPLLAAVMGLLAAALGEEPRLARDSLRPRVAAALARVGEAARPAALILNPRDMAWARAQLAAALADDGVALVADAAIAEGGFRLRAGAATIEDSLAGRIDRLAGEARALLSEAMADSEPPSSNAAPAGADAAGTRSRQAA